MRQFNLGDIVVLKSDAATRVPIRMTVNKYVDENSVECIWRIGMTQEFKVMVFNAETLILDKEKPSRRLAPGMLTY